MTDLRAYLRSLDGETLAELLYEQAERDPELRARLQQRAGEAGGDLAEVRSLLDRAVPGRRHLSQQDSVDEAAKIGAVLDTLRRLLDAGTQADLAPLARRAVDRISEALQHTDDSSGVVSAELHRAVSLYARACAAHPPKPENLADWILSVAFHGPGWPEIDLADFATALGEPGLRRIKFTVDKVLAEIEPGKPGELPAGQWVRRGAAERLDEQLAEISGDVDGLLEILSRQPPRLDVSLKIVRVLRAAGRTTEAVAYAARALSQDKGPARAPVVDALAETFREAGRDDELLDLRRTEFERTPALKTFLALRDVSVEPARWETDRGVALALLHARAAQNAAENGAAADELVRVLLAEERPQEAWEAARQHPCSLPVRLELAQLREAEHPADALPVYKLHIEWLIEQKDAARYEQAAKWLRKVRTLHRKAGTPGEFPGYLAELVGVHKRKARLIGEIRRARIALPKG